MNTNIVLQLMNTSEILQVLTQAQKLGLTTFGQLKKLFEDVDAVSKNDKINYINLMYVNFGGDKK